MGFIGGSEIGGDGPGIGLPATWPRYSVTLGNGPLLSGSGAATYHSATTRALTSGTYEIEWNVVFQCSAAGATPSVEVQIGGIQIPTAFLTSGTATTNGERVSVSGNGDYVQAVTGTTTVVILVKRESGSGNVRPKAGHLRIRRVR